MTKTIFALLITAGLAVGQASHAPAKKSGTSSGKTPVSKSANGTAGLPSRATVESFLRHVFGWDSTMKIAVKEIKPAAAPGIAEIVVHAETAKGPGDSAIFVTSDHKHAIAGQMFPFGGQAGVKPTNAQIDAFVKQMTANSPGLTWTVYQVKPNAIANLTEVTVLLTNPQGQRGAQSFFVTPDGQHVIIGDNGPFGADPFAAARAELAKGINGPSKGAAKPTITLVEFGDLECPACKAAMPTVERLVKDLPQARLVFQQFPLVSIHHWAYKAAGFGDCIARQNNETYWKFMDAVYAAQEDISSHVESADPNKKPDLTYAEQKLTELAGQVGMNGKQIAACAADPATSLRVDHSMQLGKDLNVTSTPTLYTNGRRITTIGSMPYESLKKIIEYSGTPAGK